MMDATEPQSSFRYLESEGLKLAELRPDASIGSLREALDLMAEASYSGAAQMMLQAGQLPADFFDLSSGVAGEILQKFAQYGVRLAIIGDFGQYPSKALQAFIAESNRGKQIFFVADREAAIARLSGAAQA